MAKRKALKQRVRVPAAPRPLTIDDVTSILGRALLDRAYRDRLLVNSDRVLLDLGIAPSAQTRQFFRRLNSASFASAADLMDLESHPRPPVIHFKS